MTDPTIPEPLPGQVPPGEHPPGPEQPTPSEPFPATPAEPPAPWPEEPLAPNPEEPAFPGTTPEDAHAVIGARRARATHAGRTRSASSCSATAHMRAPAAGSLILRYGRCRAAGPPK